MRQDFMWCCINYKFGTTNEPMILTDSVKSTRKQSIAWFIKGSGDTWRHWREKIGWRCVKVIVTIEII